MKRAGRQVGHFVHSGLGGGAQIVQKQTFDFVFCPGT